MGGRIGQNLWKGVSKKWAPKEVFPFEKRGINPKMGKNGMGKNPRKNWKGNPQIGGKKKNP